MTEKNIPDRNETYVAGDSALLELTVKNDDDTVRDVTGYDATFALAEDPGDTALLTKSTSGGAISIVDAANGRIDVTISAGDTSGLGDVDGKDYYYEVEMTDNSGSVVTTVTGRWKIQSDTA